MTTKKTVLIAGAGPAGLTAALELLRQSDVKPILFESLDQPGGISRTINYKGNRMDIGGHRFFSKSDWVMKWWQDIMPMAPEKDERGISVVPAQDTFMLIRSRLSRIYFLRKFFSYPVSLSAETIRNLGAWRICKIGITYCWASLFQRKPERNLEDFFVNRFGTELYGTFFKDYTEKVWGTACDKISPDWGAQRVKGLSILKTLTHALRKLIVSPLKHEGISQKATNTSLIERFMYPKLGPGQMWESVAQEVLARGGEIHYGQTVTRIVHDGKNIKGCSTVDQRGQKTEWGGDWFISSMPVKDFVQSLSPPPPEAPLRTAEGLVYRDFITVGLLVSKLSPTVASQGERNLVPDNWIYIQEPDVRLGRLQVFNNWSPALVNDPSHIWLGLEYFCNEGDDLWQMSAEEFATFAVAELEKIGLVNAENVLDAHVVKVPKAYPAYFGSYDRFSVIREYLDQFENLFLVGRNGMHRYNNQDHSMLTAKLAVERILGGSNDKAGIWSINVDDDYHEEKREAP